jgi:hypothetical protein
LDEIARFAIAVFPNKSGRMNRADSFDDWFLPNDAGLLIKIMLPVVLCLAWFALSTLEEWPF